MKRWLIDLRLEFLSRGVLATTNKWPVNVRKCLLERLSIPLVFCLFIVHSSASAVTVGCQSSERTPLEEAYCEIVKKGGAKSLPGYRDFRRNPKNVQRLLLKRPAIRYGVELPAPKTKTQITAKPTPKRRKKKTVGNSLEKYCQLLGSSITCDDKTYRLIDNLPNSKLENDVFNDQTVLDLPRFKGGEPGVLEYLDKTYPLYIEAMLEIGLGASTMSFTKFHHTFGEVRSQKGDFSLRMAAMYEFLKMDKAKIAVKSRYNTYLPESLKECKPVSSHLIVCDNVKQNWVYKTP